MRFTQQRPVMSAAALRTELELILTERVQAGPSGDPDPSQIRKASRDVDKVVALVERLLRERGVTLG